MDNICHTLVGAAMAEAGLKRHTAYASATLMIAANLPDLDVLVFATDVPSISFRRGWTHGVAGQALLPIGLTLLVMAWARWRGKAGLKPRPTTWPPATAGPPLRPARLLALSYLALYSHLLLDFLNTYGVRLLAPVEWRWFYGDAVFIVDPWLWLALGIGVWVARRKRTPQVAGMALGAAAGYVLVMLASAAVSRQAVIREWRAERGYDPSALMVGPVPVSPFSHEVIIDAGDHYETGTYRFWSPRLQLDAERIPKNDHAPEVATARAAPPIRSFLVWSRFPVWQVEHSAKGATVTVQDMRFRAGGVRFSASTTVP
jgi:inner membrane protein